MARLILVSLLTTGSARAGDDACRADVERLCAGISPGGGRISACLKANEAQVSPGCRAELASVARKVKEVGAACEDDVRSFCADVKPGQWAVLRCLADNKFSLAPACQEVIRGAQEKAAEFEKACGKDARKLCQGIPRGQGRVLACMKSREAELSPACRGLMAN
jgi:hypothetical protein